MGLMLTNKETQEMAEELARRLHRDVEAVVTMALREKLAKTRTPEERNDMLSKIHDIVEEVSPLIQDLPDHGDLLYDDKGLPK